MNATASPSTPVPGPALQFVKVRHGLFAAAASTALLCLGSVFPAQAQVGIGAPSTSPVKEQTRALGPAFGQREFESNCASCHGMSGRGDGPLVGFLSKSAPDLTQLAKNNSGVFPIARLYEVIEGGAVPAHGTRDMPVWGQDYRIQAATYFMDTPYDPEFYVRSRILALVEYLSRIQAK